MMMKTLDRCRAPRRRRGRTACAMLVAIVLLGANAAVASSLGRDPASAGDADRSAILPQAGTMLAQAGSSGGSVIPPGDMGKTRKSISGGEPQAQPAPAATPKPSAGERSQRATRRRAAGARPAARATRCPNIVGVWSSWASGLIGKNDTTFYANGTGVHRTGIRGRWWCENGQLHIEWPDGRPGVVEVSADGRTITAGGKLHMRRE